MDLSESEWAEQLAIERAAERLLERALPGDLGAALWECAGPEAEQVFREIWPDNEPIAEIAGSLDVFRTLIVRVAARLLQSRLDDLVDRQVELLDIQSSELQEAAGQLPDDDDDD